MQVFDIKFDNNQADLNMNLDAGVVEIKVTENNPQWPGGAQFNLPLDPMIEKMIAQAPNLFIKWALQLAQVALDKM